LLTAGFLLAALTRVPSLPFAGALLGTLTALLAAARLLAALLLVSLLLRILP
jgi:hypothetical protein